MVSSVNWIKLTQKNNFKKSTHIPKLYLKILFIKPGVAEHAFNPSTCEAEVDVSMSVWGQTGLQNEFQASQKYAIWSPQKLLFIYLEVYSLRI